jgi:hypothetical protein
MILVIHPIGQPSFATSLSWIVIIKKEVKKLQLRPV